MVNFAGVLNDRTKRIIAVSLALLGALLAVPVFGINLDPQVFSTLISVGTAMLVAGIVLYAKGRGGEVVRDERTNRIAQKAASYSWFGTYALIALLFWVWYYKLYPISVDGVLAVIFYFMIVSYVAAQWLVARSGRVE